MRTMEDRPHPSIPVGAKFVVVEPRALGTCLTLGMVLTLFKNDGTNCPLFLRPDGVETDVMWRRLRPFRNEDI
jgi:hypothetical protein